MKFIKIATTTILKVFDVKSKETAASLKDAESSTNKHQSNSMDSSATPILVNKPASKKIPVAKTAISLSTKEKADKILFNIPPDVLELLWFKSESLVKHNTNRATDTFELDTGEIYFNVSIEEPSLIDVDEPIMAREFDEVAKMNYYPSYKSMSPEQRFTYLTWLQDITQPIDIGYVFVFYYGLERHLIEGNFDKAFNTILDLRLYHKNDSFLSYSSDALLIASFLYPKNTRLKRHEFMNLDGLSSQVFLFLVGTIFGTYNSEDIIKTHSLFGFTNKRYIESDYQLFESTLADNILKLYGAYEIPISTNDFKESKEYFVLALANYSMNRDGRFARLPNISTNSKISMQIYKLLVKTHEDVKSELARKRSKTRKDVSDSSKNTSKQSPNKTENEEITVDFAVANNKQIKRLENNFSELRINISESDGYLSKEEEISIDFYMEHRQQIKYLDDKFFELYTAKKNFQALEALDKIKKFCFHYGECGKIYYIQNYEKLFNSQNPCFSYEEVIRERIAQKADFERLYPEVLQIISENNTILQKDLYARYSEEEKLTVKSIVEQLQNTKVIVKIKKGRYVALTIATNDKIE